MDLEALQNRIRYRFSDRGILLQSLTHTSYGHEYLKDKPVAMRDNERFEFLGDAVLDLILTDILLEAYPEAREGQLSKMRAAIVNEYTLTQIAESIGLHECLRLGKGEVQSGGEKKPSILSSALEALVAAVYLDGGYHAVYPVVRHLFGPFFTQDEEVATFTDFKTLLQEQIQARMKLTPTYHLMNSFGPDHDKVFEVEVRIQDETNTRSIGRAVGSSKKQAEQKAAEMALSRFEITDLDLL